MSSKVYEALFQDIDRHMDEYMGELCDFLRIPGVSTYPDGRENMEKAAEWILEKLRTLGFEGGLRQTEGWPIVMAEHTHRPGAPRLLIYGHYDVQPEMPVEEWISPPFEPTIRDGAVYARGANDDKGQVYTYLKALESYRRVYGEIPLNILFVIEGEEEIGSKSLLRLMREQPELMQADIFLMSDSSMLSKEIPAITCGFRGIYGPGSAFGPFRGHWPQRRGGALQSPGEDEGRKRPCDHSRLL